MLGVRIPPALLDPSQKVEPGEDEKVHGTQRFVLASFLGAGVLLWATLAKLFGAIAYALDIADPPLLGTFTVTSAVGLALSVGAVLFAARHQPSLTFSNEVVAEVTKVTWPSKKETKRSTVVVIVTTLVIAVMLGVFDFFWAELTGLIYT